MTNDFNKGQSMSEKWKILVVDDDLVDRMAVRRALKASGEEIEILETDNCTDAIAVLKQIAFDCVFLDYRLPDTDGLTLLTQLRSAGFKMPIVVLTGQGDEQIAVEMMKAGASDYLAKGKLSAESLSRSLRNAIRIYRAEREAELIEQKLKISEERYRLVLEGSSEAIWDWDINKNEIYWNDRLVEIIGLSGSELGGESEDVARTWESLSELIHPEDREKVKAALVRHLCDNAEFNLEFRLRHLSGEYRYCMTRGKAQRDRQGRPIRMAGIINDITLTKLAEEQLRRRFEQLETIYQITEAVSRAAGLEELYQVALKGLQRALKADRTSVLLFDADGVMRFKAWCKLSEEYRRSVEGHSPWTADTNNPQPICIADVETSTIADFRFEIADLREKVESANSNLKSTIINEGIRALAFIPLIAQEKPIGKFMLYYNAPHEFTGQEIQLAQTIASNVAFAIERKRAEEALYRREQEFKALVENAPDIIARYDKEWRLIYVSPALERGTGTMPQTIIGKTLSELELPGEMKLKWQEGLRDAFATGLQQVIEFDYPTPHGQTRYYQARLVPELAQDGSPEYVLSVARDITDRKRAEDSQRFLADASTILSLSLECDVTWSNLADLAVPQIADWCVIDVLDAGVLGAALNVAALNTGSGENMTAASMQISPTLHRVAFSHIDQSKIASLQGLQTSYSVNLNASLSGSLDGNIFKSLKEATSIVGKVLQTGQSQLYPKINDEKLFADVLDEKEVTILCQLAPKSIMCVPLVARGRTLGAIAFGISESSRQYTQADLKLAEDLARRAALAVDNARLYRESQEATQNLRKAIVILGEQQQQLRTLQRLTNLLNQRLGNLPDLLQVMVQSVCDAICGAQFCFIVLHNAQCDRLVLTVAAGMGVESLQLEDALDDVDGWLTKAVSTGEFQFSPAEASGKSQGEREEGEGNSIQNPKSKIQNSSSFSPLLPSSIPASVCAVAIESAEAGRLGILAIGNWQDPYAFDGEDRHLLVAVGEQAAIAINNARLIKALEEREDRLAHQNQLLANQNRELENQRQQIQLQNLQLLEAARLKSQFLASVSHELRTPLNAIIGFSQLILRSAMRARNDTVVETSRKSDVDLFARGSEQPHEATTETEVSQMDAGQSLASGQENMVERILNNGKQLLTLIDDILDLSKIEAGRMELEREQINLANLVTATAEELRSLAEDKQLEYQILINLTNPLIVNDSARLRQVLMNLLSNAIKFTNVGKVKVEASEVGANRLALIVTDTGIGIAEENLEQIFEEFRQLDQSTTKLHYGTGLGLAIIKSLVHLMKGKVTVKSKLGEGSIFRVEIPRELPSSPNGNPVKKTRRLLK
ncbi:PAS domain S-box protein [Aerosakkonema sp. BLCC-F183]|uniref:PAS domain S-box protein n=1 Tax=Aerosakkonema sp. BLCC-F183 TaxID=3342834 RepID=UPI0035BA118E